MPFMHARDETKARVIERVEGGWSLQRLGREAGFPSRSRVQAWAREDPAFRARLDAAMARGGIRRRHPRAAAQAKIIDRIERGWTLERLQREPGFPALSTVMRWAVADPGWRRRLDEAQRWRVKRAEPDAWAPTIDWDCAQRLLARVKGGESLARLVLEPGFPHWKKLRRWRRERPDFDAALKAAFPAARRAKWAAFDQAVADRIIVRVSAGERLRDVTGRKAGAPSLPILHRWRRRNREFNAALRIAIGVGAKRRGRARRGPGERLTGAVIEAICEGASLRDLARRADMPSGATLHTWLRDDADFAQAVDRASWERDYALRERQLRIATAMRGANDPEARRVLGAIGGRIARMQRGRGREEED